MYQFKIRLLRWITALALISVSTVTYAQTLDECVKIALENNLDLQRQQLNPMLAKSDLADKKSQNYGKFSVISTYTHYNLPRTLAPLTPASIANEPALVPTTEDLFSAAIAYELPLFTGFSHTRSVKISELQQEIAHSAVALSREQLIYNVKTLYINILSLRAQEKAQEKYIEALQRLYDDITNEIKIGKRAKIDQLKAAADLKSGQTGKIKLAGDLAITKDSLCNLLNIDEIKDVCDISISPETIPDIPETTEGLQRLQAVRLATEKSKELVKKSLASYYPQLYLNTSYGQNFGPNDDSNQYSGDWNNQDVWQAGLVLKWDIFNFGSSKSKVKKAKIAEQQSLYEQEQAEKELTRALKESITRINVAVSEYQSSKDELALTTETEIIEQIRFKQGQIDTADLLYTKARNQLANSRFISAGYRYKTAQFHLDYLLEKGEK